MSTTGMRLRPKRWAKATNVSEVYTIMWHADGGGSKTITCSFSCACTVAKLMEGFVIDEDGRHYSPDDYEDLTHHNLGIAIASDIMMWRAMGVKH